MVILICQGSLEICIQGELVVLLVGHDSGLLVVADSLLEEVGLSIQRDVLHEVKWILDIVDLGAAQLDEKPVRHKLDVDLHEVAVHADQVNGQGLGQELCFDCDCLADDFFDALLRGLVQEVVEHEAGEVGVQALVARDELVTEGETGHEATLLQPENSCETTGEKDALD